MAERVRRNLGPWRQGPIIDRLSQSPNHPFVAPDPVQLHPGLLYDEKGIVAPGADILAVIG